MLEKEKISTRKLTRMECKSQDPEYSVFLPLFASIRVIRGPIPIE